MKFLQTDKILMVGRSGCGKSHLGNQISEIFPRLIIFDSLDEHHKKSDSEQEVKSFDEFSSVIKMIQLYKLTKFKIIVKIDTSHPDNKEIINHYLKLIYHVGDVFVVIEETQDYCTPYEIPRYFQKCMTSGRHFNIGFLFTTQRPSFLNKTILSQCTHIFVGNLIDQNDNKAVSSFIDAKKNEISELPNYSFLWFNPQRTPHTIKISPEK